MTILILSLVAVLSGAFLMVALMVMAGNSDRQIDLIEPRDLLDADDKIN